MNKENDSASEDPVTCPNCNQETNMIWVHGHFQCEKCKVVTVSCCEAGECVTSDNKKM